MTQEDKAKAYDKALDLMKDCIPDEDGYVHVRPEDIFPELAESEDEKIRKEIIKYFKKYPALSLGDYNVQDILAWVEKQGEQKPVDLALYNDLKPWEKPEYIIKAINRKRVEPALKGDALHKFKNELNSLKQILHLLYDGYNNPVNYRLALHWASWGAQNLQGYFGMNKEEREKMDDVTSEQKPVDPDTLIQQRVDALANIVAEQKPTDKVEPKFKVGDWITNGNITIQIEAVKNNCYLYCEDCVLYSTKTADKVYHLWTIQDAKDGDVLCYKDEVSLYKHDIKNCTKQETTFGGFVYYCCYDGKRFIVDSLYSLIEQDKMDIHPATKEQRDTLERAITNAGYRWDKENLKLEKI